ncbi:MAG: archaeosortase H N-terminal-like domain-containing protein [Candidatus Hermodarchaeota archaeon]
MKQITLKKIFIWILLTINLFFAFIIGLTIPLLEAVSFMNLGFIMFPLIMIPLLIILNYVILDRFHYYLRHINDKGDDLDANT